MAKAINDDICIKGSTLIIGVKFPKVDDKYDFTYLLNNGLISIKYYIINTNTKYPATLYSIADITDDNSRAFTISDTSSLHEGVLMVETTAQIPAHDGIPSRTEIARCSTGIAIIE